MDVYETSTRSIYNLKKQFMKRINYFPRVLILLFLFVAIGCNDNSSDDSTNNPVDPNNGAPSSFSLLTVTDNATDITLTPQLTWELATDPEGDAISYDVYLAAYDEDLVLIASDLTANSYNLSNSLSVFENYVWKVIAKDAQGNATESNINQFTTRGYNLMVDASDTGMITRSGYTTVSHNGKQWVACGYKAIGSVDIGYRNDLYSSTDGIIWSGLFNAQFESRTFHANVVHNDKMWIIAGEGGERPSNTYNFNDVWSSTDGVVWNASTTSASFSARRFAASASFDNKLWIIAGQDGNFNWKNDVWYSEDGATWTQATSAAPFDARGNVSAFRFDNKLWVVGGNDDNGQKNDIWYTENGADWTSVDLPSAFLADPNSLGLGGMVFRSRILLFRGDTVYFSKNGLDWFTGTLEVPEDAFGAVNLATQGLFQHDDTISFLAGSDFSGSIASYTYSE